MKFKFPLNVGDRVRHYGHQWTREATATVIKVQTGVDGWEYTVRLDKGGTSRWHSSKTIFVDRPELYDPIFYDNGGYPT
jgi:hypothetical protein